MYEQKIASDDSDILAAVEKGVDACREAFKKVEEAREALGKARKLCGDLGAKSPGERKYREVSYHCTEMLKDMTTALSGKLTQSGLETMLKETLSETRSWMKD